MNYKIEKDSYIITDITGQAIHVLFSDISPKSTMTDGDKLYKITYRKRRDMSGNVFKDVLIADSIENARKRFRRECRQYTLLDIHRMWDDEYENISS